MAPMPSAASTNPAGIVNRDWRPGNEHVIVNRDWRSGIEYDSDSTNETNAGQCTTPESEEPWMTSSTQAPPHQTNPYCLVGPQSNSGVNTYAQHPPAQQMPIPGIEYAPAPTTATSTTRQTSKAPARKKRSFPGKARVAAKKSGQAKSEGKPSPSSETHSAANGACCPFCKATFAGGEAGAIPIQEQGRSTKKATGSGSGEEIRQRCFRNRKDVRRHNRQGKWWSSVGYNGDPYCQRCSEIFRDHIIRTMSNSAKCTREHPCHDCEQILCCFTDGRENAFQKMDERRSKAAPGHNGPYTRRKRVQR